MNSRTRRTTRAPVPDEGEDAPDAPLPDAEQPPAPAQNNPPSIQELARPHAEAAFRVLVKVVNDENATASTRVNAANAILDRAWGKATLPTGDHEHDTVRLEIMRRIIVKPGHSDSGSVRATSGTESV